MTSENWTEIHTARFMDPDLNGSKRGWEVKHRILSTVWKYCYRCGHFSRLIRLTVNIHLSDRKRSSDAEMMRKKAQS